MGLLAGTWKGRGRGPEGAADEAGEVGGAEGELVHLAARAGSVERGREGLGGAEREGVAG